MYVRTLKTFLALAVLALVVVPVQAEDMTLDQVIAKNVEARGGAAAWDAVASAKINAKMNMGGGIEAPVTFYFAKPNKMRVDFVLQGSTITQAYDGTKGWQVMPLMGVTDPQEMSEEELKGIKRQDFLRGLLMSYKEKGYTAELMGKEEVEGTEAYKIKIQLEDEDVVYSFLDTEYFMEFMQKVQGKNPQTGQQMTVNISYGDFKPVGDIIMPYSMEITPEGAPAGQSVVIESIELNSDVPASLFAMPAPAAAGQNG